MDGAERPRLGVAAAEFLLPAVLGDGDVREGGGIGLGDPDHAVDHDVRRARIAGGIALRVDVVGIVDVLAGLQHLGDHRDVLADGEGRDGRRAAGVVLDLVVTHHVGAGVRTHIHRDVARRGERHVDVGEEELLAGRRAGDVGEEDHFGRLGVAVILVAVEREDVVDVREGVDAEDAVVAAADLDQVAGGAARPRRVDVERGPVDVADHGDVAVISVDGLHAGPEDGHVVERARLVEVDDLPHTRQPGRVDGDRAVGVVDARADQLAAAVKGDAAGVGHRRAAEGGSGGDVHRRTGVDGDGPGRRQDALIAQAGRGVAGHGQHAADLVDGVVEQEIVLVFVARRVLRRVHEHRAALGERVGQRDRAGVEAEVIDVQLERPVGLRRARRRVAGDVDAGGAVLVVPDDQRFAAGAEVTGLGDGDRVVVAVIALPAVDQRTVDREAVVGEPVTGTDGHALADLGIAHVQPAGIGVVDRHRSAVRGAVDDVDPEEILEAVGVDIAFDVDVFGAGVRVGGGVGITEGGERLDAVDRGGFAVGEGHHVADRASRPRFVDVELVGGDVGHVHVAVGGVDRPRAGAGDGNVVERGRLAEVDDLLERVRREVGRVDGDRAARVVERRAGQQAGAVDGDVAGVGDRRAVHRGVDRDVDRAGVGDGEPVAVVPVEQRPIGQRQHALRILDAQLVAGVEQRVVHGDHAVGGPVFEVVVARGDRDQTGGSHGVGQRQGAALIADVVRRELSESVIAVARDGDRALRPDDHGVAAARVGDHAARSRSDGRERRRVGLSGVDRAVDDHVRRARVAGGVALRVNVVGIDVLTGHEHLGDQRDVFADGEGRGRSRGAGVVLDRVVAHQIGAAVGAHIHRDVARRGERHVDVGVEEPLAGRRRRDVGEEDHFGRLGVAVLLVAVERKDVVDVREGVDAEDGVDAAADVDLVAVALAGRPRRVDVERGHVDVGDHGDVAVISVDGLHAGPEDGHVVERARLIEVDDLLHARQPGRVDGDRAVRVREARAGESTGAVDGDAAGVGDVGDVHRGAVAQTDGAGGLPLVGGGGLHREARGVDRDAAGVAAVRAVGVALDFEGGAGEHLQIGVVLQREADGEGGSVFDDERAAGVVVLHVSGDRDHTRVDGGVEGRGAAVRLEQTVLFGEFDDGVGEVDVVGAGRRRLLHAGVADPDIRVGDVEIAGAAAGDREAGRVVEREFFLRLVGGERVVDLACYVEGEAVTESQPVGGDGERIAGADGDRRVVVAEAQAAEGVVAVEGHGAVDVRVDGAADGRILDDHAVRQLDPVTGERTDVQGRDAVRVDGAVVDDAADRGEGRRAGHVDRALGGDGPRGGVGDVEGGVREVEHAVALGAERQPVDVGEIQGRTVLDVQRGGLVDAALGLGGGAAVNVHVDHRNRGVGDLDLVAAEEIVALDGAVFDLQHAVVGAAAGAVVAGDVETSGSGGSGHGVDRRDVGVLEGHGRDRVAVGAAHAAADEEPAVLPLDAGGAGEDDVLAVADAHHAGEGSRQIDGGRVGSRNCVHRALDVGKRIGSVDVRLAVDVHHIARRATRPIAVHIESSHLLLPYFCLCQLFVEIKIHEHNKAQTPLPTGQSVHCCVRAYSIFGI